MWHRWHYRINYSKLLIGFILFFVLPPPIVGNRQSIRSLDCTSINNLQYALRGRQCAFIILFQTSNFAQHFFVKDSSKRMCDVYTTLVCCVVYFALVVFTKSKYLAVNLIVYMLLMHK